MKKAKQATDLRGLAPAEMEQKLREMDEETFRLKFRMSMGQTEGLRRIREMRKDRARIKTYQREKQLQEAK